MSAIVTAVLALIVVALAGFVVVKTIRVVPQAMAGIVERFGRYHRTLHAGLNIVVPVVDRLRPLIDLREQVVSPGRPGRAESDRAAAVDPGLDGEADARGARQARRDPDRGRLETVRDFDCGRREAGRGAQGTGRGGSGGRARERGRRGDGG